jgi:hypothetical protein
MMSSCTAATTRTPESAHGSLRRRHRQRHHHPHCENATPQAAGNAAARAPTDSADPSKDLLAFPVGKIYTIDHQEIAVCEVHFDTWAGQSSGGSAAMMSPEMRYDVERQFGLPKPTLSRCSLFAILLALDVVYAEISAPAAERSAEKCDLAGFDRVCVCVKHKSTYGVVANRAAMNSTPLGRRLAARVASMCNDKLVQKKMPVVFLYVESDEREFYENLDRETWNDEDSVASADGMQDALRQTAMKRAALSRIIKMDARMPARRVKKTRAEVMCEHEDELKRKKDRAGTGTGAADGGKAGATESAPDAGSSSSSRDEHDGAAPSGLSGSDRRDLKTKFTNMLLVPPHKRQQAPAPLAQQQQQQQPPQTAAVSASNSETRGEPANTDEKPKPK